MKIITFDIFIQALMLILDIHLIHSVTVSVPKRVGVIGKTTVSLKCVYTLLDSESFSGLTWGRKRSSERDFVEMVGVDSAGLTGYTYEGVALQNRTVLKFVPGVFTITYIDVMCEDEATYRCTVLYWINTYRPTWSVEMFFQLQAVPKKPLYMYLSDYSEFFTEYQHVFFTCFGNVGKPPGSFWWFVYRGTEMVNKTSEAYFNPLTFEQYWCSFYQKSVLHLYLTRADDGIVVMCQPHNPSQTPPIMHGCWRDSDLCLQTKPLVVHYPVRKEDITVYSIPSGPDFSVDSFVTISCSVPSNPPAKFTWEKIDTNTIFSGSVLNMRRLTQLDKGQYVCTAKNKVSGVLYSASTSLYINIPLTLSLKAFSDEISFILVCRVHNAIGMEDTVSFHSTVYASVSFSQKRDTCFVLDSSREGYAGICGNGTKVFWTSTKTYMLKIDRHFAKGQGWWCKLQRDGAQSNNLTLHHFSVSISATSLYALLNKAFTFTCTVKYATGMDDMVRFFRKIKLGDLGTLHQKHDECKVFHPAPNGYQVTCEEGTDSSSASTKTYVLKIDEVLESDGGEYWCDVVSDQSSSSRISIYIHYCEGFFYGKDCTEECHCRNKTEVCHPMTGECTSGCAVRWTGAYCELCKDSRHGDKCDKMCNCRDKNEVCDKHTGRCESGCPDGWYGDYCNDRFRCRCAEGCSGIVEKKECASCERGFHGRYCQQDDNECLTGMHNCTMEGEECVNTCGSFKCTCRDGYISRGTRCVRKSNWSKWQITKSSCSDKCLITVTERRFCVNPPPIHEQDSCKGKDQITYYLQCAGLKCADGQWSSWRRGSAKVCRKSCTQRVNYTRSCTDPEPSPHKLYCKGNSHIERTEPCTGDECDECASRQHRCFDSEGQTCTETPPSYKCVCKEGYTKVRGGLCVQYISGFFITDECASRQHRCFDSEGQTCKDTPPSYDCVCKEGYTKVRGGQCVRNGVWSTWIRVFESECFSYCKRKVNFEHYCSQPAASKEGQSCEGEAHAFGYYGCIGGKCVPKCESGSHNCTREGELCVDDSLYCQCRKDYIRIKDRCVSRGYWSDWYVIYGNCNSTCKRMKTKQRHCFVDPIIKDEGNCKGKQKIIDWENCDGVQCEDGRWSPWKRILTGDCGKNCIRMNTYLRSCTNQEQHSPWKYLCKGDTEIHYTEPCTDGDCVMDECATGMHNCYDKEGQECKDLPKSYKCVCKNGYTRVKDHCARNGGWSTWIFVKKEPCHPFCEQLVTYQRFCTDPLPDDGGKICLGAPKRDIYVPCVGNQCEKDTAKAKAPSPESSSNPYVITGVVVVVIVGVVLIVAVTMYLWYQLLHALYLGKLFTLSS
ncbi:uncharacterized protein LOC121388832 isoform X2 [Gigantopelta aegis]|uniref:uncharacterized protein LOC121388832 isoform X2 n=1 Tax=Gigantopelta aegis TaxID=1735272 RepID=UPI001B8885FC|nr:uncharacterized protein LOC121388832 isoform X2 [Gigantopelta aegis]